jgi:hypothetical protein
MSCDPYGSSKGCGSQPELEGCEVNRYCESGAGVDESSFERLINIQSYSDEELKHLAARLSDEEHEVSMRRRLLHGELDILRAEMVRRLRDKGSGPKGLVQDGDVALLSEILSGHGGHGEPPKE